ncbi:MAG: hypothetical protein KDD61_02380 [Bdellovibrionales bacterium]|nr:hypothetical protein [Bdellovibrionales bacterium]
MRKKYIGTFLTLTVITLAGCTRDKSSSSQIRLVFSKDTTQKIQSLSSFPTDKKVCYGVNVNGPGISEFQANGCSPKLSVYTGFIEASSGEITLNVPSGENRNLELFAYLAEISEACPLWQNSEQVKQMDYSKVFKTGSTTGILIGSEEQIVEVTSVFPGEANHLVQERQLATNCVSHTKVNIGSDVTISEGAVAAIDIVLDVASPTDVHVNVVSLSGTALAGTDFAALNNTIKIPAGETVGKIFVPIIEDISIDSGKSFSVQILSATGASLGNQTTAQVSIVDNDTLPLSGVTDISLNQHSCAVVSGGVKCWGYNNQGSVGNGTTTNQSIPQDVIGLTSGFVKVSAGQDGSCAVNSGGAVFCWGSNGNGQLGDGTTTQQNSPVSVSGLSGSVVQAERGYLHSCALLTSGAVECWGGGLYGQMGDGSTTDNMIPAMVTGLSSGVSQIAVGQHSTCALVGGQVQCWGSGLYGQLGYGGTTTQSVPVTVTGISTATQIARGSTFGCALLADGTVQCWGTNSSGQLGDGTTSEQLTPVAVLGLSNVTQVIAGLNSTCAIINDGSVKCWGSNYSQEIDSSSGGTITTPISVPDFLGVTKLAIGSGVICGVKSDSTMICRGSNSYGSLGLGYFSNSSPVATDASGVSSGITTMSASYESMDSGHTCAVQNGAAICWGENYAGELGNGTTVRSSVPVFVSGLGSGVSKVSVGGTHSCALLDTGAVMCWGSNNNGQLGNNSTTNSSIPVAVSGLSSGVKDIKLGDGQSCALLTDGSINCWGANYYGQLGDSTTTNRLIPTSVVGLSGSAAQLEVSPNHACALLSDSSIQCWGYNYYGQLGNNATVNSSIPVTVSVVSGHVTQLSLGSGHTCTLLDTGSVECWGSNSSGQLGDGTTVNSIMPVSVSNLSEPVMDISTGSSFTCAILKNSLQVKCWGNNYNGQLGTGNNTNLSQPGSSVQKLAGALQIESGYNYTCAKINNPGALKCWGSNNSGQLGINFASGASLVLSP